ncbi:MAG: copper resistance protein CopC [Chloroflexi bacterium]|nr:copper resistance protein CopC [Chloroflexota bacterium]
MATTTFAHGVIDQAEPPVGGAAPVSPARVQVWFTEPIEPRFSALEVYAAGASSRIDLGDIQLEGDRSLFVSLPPGLPQGSYTVLWRVFTLSDGHTTSGSYSFGVGVPADPSQTVATERTPLADASRFLSLGGQAVFVGVAVFGWAVRLDDEARFRRSLFWAMQAARAALGLGALGALYVQAHNLNAPLVETLTTQWGALWLARTTMIVVIALRIDSLMRGKATGPALLAGGFLLLTTSLTSHSAARFGPAGVLADWAHLWATSVWAGGVLCAALALTNGETKFLTNFSILATAAVGGLIVSGLWLGGGQVGTWPALLLTEYGRALLLKLAAVGLALGLGLFNMVRRANRLVSGLEAALMLIIVLLAAALTNLPPAFSQITDGAPTRVEQVGKAGELTATVALWPARTGTNTVEVRLTKSGQPLIGAEASLQFEPLDPGAVVSTLALDEIGQGVYSATGANLTSEGRWQILLAVNATEFVNFNYWVGPDRAARTPEMPAGFLVRAVGWLNRYATATAAGLLLVTAGVWSWLAWRSLRAQADVRLLVVAWLAPGLLIAGAVWLWLKL